MKLVRTCLVGVMILAAPTVATGQVTINDPLVVELVGGALIEKSSMWLVRATHDTTTVPLEITLPPEATSPTWGSLRDFLMRSLHGRPAAADDRRKRFLSLSLASVDSNSVRIGIDIGVLTRCHEGWIEDGTSYILGWTLNGSWWRRHREEAIVTDSFGCPVRQ